MLVSKITELGFPACDSTACTVDPPGGSPAPLVTGCPIWLEGGLALLHRSLQRSAPGRSSPTPELLASPRTRHTPMLCPYCSHLLPCPALGRSEARLNVRPALTLSAQGPWGCQAWTAAPVSPHRVRGCRAGCRAQAAGGHCCTAVAAGAGAPPGSAEQTRTQSHGHHRRRTFIETMYRQATET